MIARDLFRLRWLDQPRVSPDGGRVAFVETTLDEAADTMCRRLLVIPAAGGTARRFDEIPDAADPAWSRDGRLAVGGDAGLWIVTDEARHVVREPVVREPDWSAAGDRLAFVRAGRVEVIAPDGSGRFAVDAPDDAGSPRWPPDGSTLALVAGDGLWLADGVGRPRRLAVPAAVVTAFAWSPDGSTLAVLGRRDRDLIDVGQRLWLVDRSSGAARELSGVADAALGSPVRGDDPRGTGRPALCWSRRTGRIYLEAVRRGRGPLVWFDPPSGSSGLLLDGEFACLAPSVSDTGRLATVVTGPSGPGEVCLLGEDGADLTRLTDADAEFADHVAPTMYLPVERDGIGLDAWLTGTASPERPRPLLVSVHGGPYYAVGWRFSFEVQRLAARGFLVLTLNPRGSSGRGDGFAAGNRGDWGGVDAADVEAVATAVAARPEVDERRLGVWGVSYGGFMAQWLLTRSSRYRTGVSENGISDFAAICAVNPARRAFWELALGRVPYSQRSPIRHADRVRAPLLLVHAEEDDNCPITQSERMLDAVRQAGGTAELVRLPGEGHLVNLVGRPSSRLRRAAAVDAWLDRTLT